MSIQLSESSEMYLKAMAELGAGDRVAVGRLAGRLGVTNVSANEMVHRLTDQGLVSHTPYKGVSLTKTGQAAACNVLRRQRLWECFLYEHLKIEWARLYELACALEHATAPEVTEALSVFLGDPKFCPRGNPIPAADGTFKPLTGLPLREVPVGATVHVLAINATETDALRYLQEREILPGCELTVIEAAPMEGPLTLRIDRQDVVLGLLLSEFVIVEVSPR
ncbi:MAG TPA: metal-dependent transcriptional regulator [Anaerolineales bacterium]|nr:metal-dependent transcriptional regulator [Anaerolineales bacterium]